MDKNRGKIIFEQVDTVLGEYNQEFLSGDLKNIVKAYFDKSSYYFGLLKKYQLPLYLFEPEILRKKAVDFKNAFSSVLSSTSFYFAMKCNNHPELSKAMIKNGYGIDVSSGVELEAALFAGAEDIVFSGPGKRESELITAILNAGKVRILVDSFGELDRLKKIAKAYETEIRIGVRLTTNLNALWRKFGIIPERLEEFYNEAVKSKYIKFEGLQFHTSWNMTPNAQCEFLKKIGSILESVSTACKNAISFIDIGGGYWPEQGEWLHYETTNVGTLEKSLDCLDPAKKNVHYMVPAKSIAFFAAEISKVIKDDIFSRTKCRICFEPGRWVCNDSIQIFVSVVDIKEPDIAIVDAGINTIGWDRFEYDYFPVLNLTRPAMKEKQFNILGSLCTPHDVWGYSYWGEDIKTGDVLMIPMQGAYTYSLRQNFIKPIPDFVVV